VDFKKANVQVATELTPWPADKLRRASVSAFGYGGANAHCILDHISTLYTDPCAVDSAVSLDHDFDLKSLINNPPCLPTRYRPSKVQSHNAIARRMVLLPFSAYDNYALTRNSEATIQAVKDHPLADIAYTLSSRRSRFRYRSYAILASEGDGEFGVRSLTEPQKVQATRIPAVGFIFTGSSNLV
jgi:acyl transferase domain-containing protein